VTDIGTVTQVVTATLGIIQFAIFAYTIYLAVDIRRALSVRPYRDQALGIGFVSLAWNLLFLGGFAALSVIHDYGLFAAVVGIVMIMLFYWVDSSVLAARKSDPFPRDILRWRELRIVVWLVLVAVTILAISVASYYQITTGTEPHYIANVGFGFGIWNLPAFIVVIVGAVALPISAYRTRDAFLRRSLKWFAAFVVVVAFVGITPAPIETFAGLAIAGYCLYRSARSLIPHGIAERA